MSIIKWKYGDGFSAMSGMDVCPYNYLRCCDYFPGPWVLQHFSVKVPNWLSQVAILSKVRKPDSF